MRSSQQLLWLLGMLTKSDQVERDRQQRTRTTCGEINYNKTYTHDKHR